MRSDPGFFAGRKTGSTNLDGSEIVVVVMMGKLIMIMIIALSLVQKWAHKGSVVISLEGNSETCWAHVKETRSFLKMN